jgi:hypothetical protein
MSESEQIQAESPRRFQFGWVGGVLLRPRLALSRIAAQENGVWLTPMLILTMTTLMRVLASGWVRRTYGMGEIPLPPDFQYYSPEMQAQYMQAMQATQSPVFIYVFPAITGLLGVWLGWLLVGGIIHLVLTLLGGRGSTGSALNLVAWAGLPFAVRDLVRSAAVLLTRQLIQKPGLAGFAPAEASGLAAYLAAWLPLMDIYLIWHMLLLILGVRASGRVSTAKATGSVVFTLLLVLALQALIGYLAGRLGSLTIIRPFF